MPNACSRLDKRTGHFQISCLISEGVKQIKSAGLVSHSQLTFAVNFLFTFWAICLTHVSMDTTRTSRCQMMFLVARATKMHFLRGEQQIWVATFNTISLTSRIRNSGGTRSDRRRYHWKKQAALLALCYVCTFSKRHTRTSNLILPFQTFPYDCAFALTHNPKMKIT